jgi:putative Mg2+ transporter-C (MgtC) family protein
METLWQELSSGLSGGKELGQFVIRMLAAVIAGAMIGFERERAGKAAGLRTHMLVSLGTCLFVLAGVGYGMSSDGLSRVIQGIVTGIGFIGAGSILKRTSEHDIKGLTTSAGIWMTSAVGVAIGLGLVGLGLISAVLGVIVLAVIGKLEVDDVFETNETRIERESTGDDSDPTEPRSL